MPRLLAALFVVGALKGLVLWQLKDHVLLQPLTNPDSGAYFELAQRVIDGDWRLGPGAYFVSPLYIYFQAFVRGAFDSISALRLVQIVLGTIAVGLMWWTTRTWFGERAAWLAAVVASATGLLTFYEISLLQASLDTFLTAASLAALTAALTRSSPAWFVTAGVVFGIHVLNRPNVVVPVAVVVVALLLLRWWKPAALVVAGVVVAMLPVTIRNVSVTGEWSLLPSHGGLNFYIGNAAEANGFYRQIPGIRPNILGQAVDARRIAEASAGRGLTDAEVSGHFGGLAWDWIRSHPHAWAALLIHKTRYTLHGQHIALPLSYPFFAHDTGSALRFLAIGPWLLIPLGLAGLYWGFDPRRPGQLVWLAYVPGTIVSIVLFFVSERYRLPLLVPLIVGSGVALDRLAQAVAARSWLNVVGRTALVVMGVVVLNWPLGIVDADGRMEERVKMAETFAGSGHIADAESWLARSSPLYPYPDAANARVAEGFARAGREATRAKDLTAALGLFERAARLDPSNTDVRDQFGLSLLWVGRLDEANTQFGAVVESDPSNADAWAHLAYIAVQQKDVDAARRHAERALTITPAHALAAQIVAAIGPPR